MAKKTARKARKTTKRKTPKPTKAAKTSRRRAAKKTKSGISPERLTTFVRAQAATFLDRPDITSVGIGHKIKNGKRTNELCVQFTVTDKQHLTVLEALDRTPIPKHFTVDGVEIATDVLERNFKPAFRPVTPEKIAKDERKVRLDPIAPGCSVGHPKITAGTLGSVVFDQHNGAACILSNWHVLHGDEGNIGDEVLQPGSYDDNRIDHNRVGRLVRSHIGIAGDCAIALIENRAFAIEVIGLGKTRPLSIAMPEIGDRVVKSGRTTGVTYGIVTRIETTSKINYGGKTGEQRIGGFEIGPDPKRRSPDGEISKGGDSGSSWVGIDKSGRPTGMMLGLHFAGEGEGDPEEHALACYAHSVFQKLEISLEQPAQTQLLTTDSIGFEESFLDTHVALPKPGTAIRNDIARTKKNGTVVRHTHYSLSMSKTRKFARWVAWNIDGAKLKKNGRVGLSFKFDPDIDEKYQVGDDVYSDNLLDRGHVARRADLVWGSAAEAERGNTDSFYFTNITPQHKNFNQSKAHGLWGELENAVYEDVDVDNLRISVFGGPVLRTNDKHYRGIQIPREFWKIVVYTEHGMLNAKAYVLSQDNLLDRLEALGLEEFKLYRVPISELEARTGLNFGALKKADAREDQKDKVETLDMREGISEITSRDALIL